MAPDRATIRMNIGASLLLAALVFLAFGGALAGDFVLFDDPMYVFENPDLQDGWTREGVRWAFTTGYAANWHPLTWLSHMLDVESYGLEPAGHHLTSLWLHAMNAILLFAALRRLTGRRGLSFFAAALWAVHPLRVESVAWIAERKDVLSMFFGLAALCAYGGKAKETAGASARGRMAWVAAWFALSLMSKPLWVTLPFLLLLLDAWPLGRWPGVSARALVREKIPLFLLAAASCAVTYFVQQAGGATRSFVQYPIGIRLANAVAACGQYLRTLAWPSGLSFFNPHPGAGLPAGAVAVALAILLPLAAWAAAGVRRRPWFAVGGLWFLGSLVPMIGLVQVGGAAWADRYTYLPHIGLWVALAWGAGEWAGIGVPAPKETGRNAPGGGTRPTAKTRIIPAVLSVALVLVLALLSRRQTAVWRDSETLFLHALGVQEENAVAHGNLGIHYVTQERPAEAERHLLRSLEIQEGNAAVHCVLGGLYASQNRTGEATEHLFRSLELDPGNAMAHANLGGVYDALGRDEETLAHLARSLEIQPRRNEATYNLGNFHLKRGRRAEAIRCYRAMLEDDPRHAKSLNNLAWLLAAEPGAPRAQAEEALALARRAIGLEKEPDASLLDTLALAQAACGDFAEAAETARKAAERAAEEGDGALGESIRSRIRGYEEGRMPPP